MAKKPISPICTDADYGAALAEIERYFENEPKPGTPEADRFDLLALVLERYESKRWPIGNWPPRRPVAGSCRKD
jgi:HTH-type transcriptional regulator/antitoxin HigA